MWASRGRCRSPRPAACTPARRCGAPGRSSSPSRVSKTGTRSSERWALSVHSDIACQPAIILQARLLKKANIHVEEDLSKRTRENRAELRKFMRKVNYDSCNLSGLWMTQASHYERGYFVLLWVVEFWMIFPLLFVSLTLYFIASKLSLLSHRSNSLKVLSDNPDSRESMF